MNRNRILGLFVAFGILTGAALSEAQYVSPPGCKNLSMTVQTALIDLNINGSPDLQFTVSRNRSANGDCDFFVVLDNGSASTYIARAIRHGGDLYPMQFYTNAARNVVLKSITEATTSADVISGKFIGNSKTDIVSYYYPVLLPNASIPAGPYLDGFKISLYEGTFASHQLSATVTNNVNFKYTKGDYVDMSLVKAGDPFALNDTTETLDYGSLTTGESLECDLVLMYNSGYVVSMSSLNNSRIKNTVSANYISYSMTLDGSPITLTNLPQVVKSGTGSSITNGTRLRIVGTIGNVAGAPNGTYTDTVSISVASNL